MNPTTKKRLWAAALVVSLPPLFGCSRGQSLPGLLESARSVGAGNEGTDALRSAFAWDLSDARTGVGAVAGSVAPDAVKSVLDQSQRELEAHAAPSDQDIKRFADNVTRRLGEGACVTAEASGADLARMQKATSVQLPSSATDANKRFFQPYLDRLQALSEFTQVTCGGRPARIGFARDSASKRWLHISLN